MKLSIIIPTKNRPNELLLLLKKIREIDCSEVIVIENNSSKENLEKYKNIQLGKNEKIHYMESDHIGAGDARNYGIEKATGDYLFFLDDDDETTNDFKTIVSKKNLTQNIYRLSYLKNGKKIKPSPFRYVTKTFLFDTVQPSTFLVKREFIMQNNIRFAKKIIHQDNHFAEMLWSTGEKQFVLNVPSIIYNTSNESIQRSNKIISRELLSISEFDDEKYKNGDIFKFKLVVNIYEFTKKYKFDVNKKIVKNLLVKEVKKLKNKKLIFKLPAYYKFQYIFWLFKISTSRK